MTETEASGATEATQAVAVVQGQTGQAATAIVRAMRRAAIKGQIIRAQSGRKGQRFAQAVTAEAMIDARAIGDTAHMALNASRRRMYRTGGGAISRKRRSCSAKESMLQIYERREARES